MSYVDDAFAKLSSSLEITPSERELASARQQQIRADLDDDLDILEDRLFGSYSRETKTKPLKDVDIFMVLNPDGDQGHYADESPRLILDHLANVLREDYDSVSVERMAAVIQFGDDVASFEVVPAFPMGESGYRIPDTLTGGWIETDPLAHGEKATKKNAECGGRWIPFIKMIKGINRELGEPVAPSFLLEVMGLDIVVSPFGRYQDEVSWFLATAAERLAEAWPDPAGYGPDVNAEMSAAQRRLAKEALEGAADIAANAVLLEDDGHEHPAVEEWRRLFGARMPRP